MIEEAGHEALACAVAQRFRDSKVELAGRWLDRIVERVALTPDRVFPTDALLDHVPVLILGIADFLEDPRRAVVTDSEVLRHAMTLGELRHQQGFTEYEILKEFEIFGAIMFAFLQRAANTLDDSGIAWAACAQRLYQAVTAIQHATTARYFDLMAARVNEREDRLRAFQRTLTHELRNRIGATLGAAELLETLAMSETERHKLNGVILRNARSMRVVLDNLLELSRLDNDARQQRRVLLSGAVAEAARQLRDFAAGENVEVRIAEDLPAVEVNAAAVELTLANLLSNAIKYRDPAKRHRFVAVEGRLESGELVVHVRDNGLGVAPAARDKLFERFYRVSSPETGEVEGTGLGLSIVREVIHGAGGRTWAEFPEEGGSVFAFALPARRTDDSARA